MDEDIPVIYGIDFQARCLVSLAAESDAVRFLIGTQSIKHENQVQLIDFDEDTNAVTRTVYGHPSGEIWHLSCCPYDADLFAACYNEVDGQKINSRAALWRFPATRSSPSRSTASSGDDAQGAITRLDKVLDLKDKEGGDIQGVIWEPTSSQKKIITLKTNGVVTWEASSTSSSAFTESSSISVEGKGHNRITSAKWSPHHSSNTVGLCMETSIRGLDLRSSKTSYLIENPHGYMVRQIDFNQNKPYDLASCGDDCTAKIWDTRNVGAPLQVLDDHSHWVWCVKYNPFHDQLLLTSSSDSRVILTSVASLSSETVAHVSDEENRDETEKHERLADGVINVYDEHEDSVYALDWSSADPWTFASLSYDGRLVINRVPRNVKYRILL
ncbi:EARP and GARP complex-interacting protein 1-like [Paramacrobiotus metropolitanus]|uniref:EARP and GARP complex-interacting protein 1-like n=1 Tax=Paramacrobiotus metropolitanus TaxID=2943436 RepID=UPI002445F01D|nr:EARP and GARP complex-interacting protein 1-like [Paramacrobiotus metropolitanus]